MSLNKADKKLIKKAVRVHLESRADTLADKLEFKQTLDKLSEGGKVGLIISVMDCDHTQVTFGTVVAASVYKVRNTLQKENEDPEIIIRHWDVCKPSSLQTT